MKRFFLICGLFLTIGCSLHAQVIHSVNSYSGNLQSNDLVLYSSVGDLVGAELTSTNSRVLHLIFYAEEKNTLGVTDGEVFVYPNPVTRILKLHADVTVTSVRIITQEGKTVLFENIDHQEIDLKELTPGIYFLRLFDSLDQQIGSYKILKQ